MSVDSPTRQQPVPPPSPPRRGGISVLTLIIAAIASVIAAVVVSHFWRSGTLWATAMTPVIVALVKEALERPAQRITEVSTLSRVRHTGDEQLVVEEVEPGPTPSARPQPAGYRTYGIRRKHWKLALVTGLLAFVLGALILTVPELVAGHSITHGSSGTTLFHGKSRAKKRAARQETQTQTVTTTTPSTVTQPPAQTTPTTPQDTTTQPPAQTTPTTPQDTTTQPPAQTTPTVPSP